MSRNLAPDMPRRIVAVTAILLLFLLRGSAGQILIILLGGIAGRLILTPPIPAAQPPSPPKLAIPGAFIALAIFALLLAESLLPAQGNIALFNAFYRCGALVFGGGHVVLPLLHDAVVRPGWVSPPLFLSGYGAAQAMPGPLFTFAAYLGALSTAGAGGFAGALIALIGIFAPGLLLTAGILPFWHRISQNSGLAAALNGVNAAVFGLLGFALINLLTNGTIRNPADMLITITALALLAIGKFPPLAVVAICAAAGLLFSRHALFP